MATDIGPRPAIYGLQLLRYAVRLQDRHTGVQHTVAAFFAEAPARRYARELSADPQIVEDAVVVDMASGGVLEAWR